MRSTSLLFLFAFASACGGKVTSIDGNQSTTTLPASDQNQLCLDTYNYVRSTFTNDDIAKMECGLDFQSNQDPSTCSSTYQTCLTKAQQQLQGTTLPTTPDCTGFDAQLAKCNTTVGEYTKCLQEEVDAMKSLEGSFPLCTQAEATSAEIAAMGKISTDCIQLMQTCQITFAPSSSSGGGVPDAGPPDGG